MRAFAQKPKAAQQNTPGRSALPGRAHPQRQPEAGAGEGRADSGFDVIARFGQDFSRIPVHAIPAIRPPARQGVGPEGGPGGRGGAVQARMSLRPHEGSAASLLREAAIYAQGKTPIRVGGQLSAWDARPLGVLPTSAHLREIQRRFGTDGVQQSAQGLAQTRGEGFAHSAVELAGLSPAVRSPSGGAIGQPAAEAIGASRAAGALPDHVREKLATAGDYDFARIAIHNDANAHRAAAQLNARAFTVGQSIYFARGEYRPATASGMHLLAHEAAHTVQQRGQGAAPDEHARTTSSVEPHEDEAGCFADFVTARSDTVPPPLTASTGAGRVQRVVSFTHADAFATQAVAANENAAGFMLSSPPPAFQWNTDVTIHGVAGDPFANFQVGFHQVERVFSTQIHWGSGANETVRLVLPDARLPRRDASAAGNTWVHDAAPVLAAPFVANGDVRSPSFDDTPGTALIPWANPIGGRVSDSGWFYYEDAFVTYLSARDTTAGTGARAFRHLANVYWNLSAGGRFDTTRAVGARVTLTSNPVNHSRAFEGGSSEFPSMHGGNIANGHDTTTTR